MLLFLHISWFSLCTLTSLTTEQNLSVNTFVTYQVRGGEESSHKYSFNNVPELMVNVKGSKFWTQTPSPLSYLGHWDLTLREQQFLRRRHLDLTLSLYCVCLVTSRNSRNVTGWNSSRKDSLFLETITQDFMVTRANWLWQVAIKHSYISLRACTATRNLSGSD